MRILVLFSFLISIKSFSCPQLAGNYSVCTATNGGNGGFETGISIEQSKDGDVSIYSLGSVNDPDFEIESVRADGKLYSDEEPGEAGVVTTTIAKCENDTLKISMTDTTNGEIVGKMEAVFSKNNDTLTLYAKASIFGLEGETNVSCK